MRAQLLVGGLRIGGMLGRFTLIFVLARSIAPDQLGLFGLISAIITFALYSLGLDFYTFSGRELARADATRLPSMLRDQLVVYGLSYLLVFPILGFAIQAGWIPAQYILPFYFILAFEHLSQEIVRVLVVVGHPVSANCVLFVRSGGWSLLLIAASLVKPGWLKLSLVLWTWAAGTLVAFALGCWILRNLDWTRREPAIDWQWIRRGMLTAAALLLGTLALRALFVADRVLLETISTNEILGVYTLYFSVANSLVTLVDGMVFTFYQPKLISSYHRSDPGEFWRVAGEFGRRTGVVTLGLALAIALASYPVFLWTGRPLYLTELPSFFLLLFAMIVFCLGYIPHYLLYAAGRDRAIIRAHWLGLGAFVAAAWLGGQRHGMLGVVATVLIAHVVIALSKQFAATSIPDSMRVMEKRKVA